MKVRVVTTITELSTPLAEHLRAADYDVEVQVQTATTHELRYREGLDPDAVTHLIDAIKPLLPTVATSEDLKGADAELCLGDGQELSNWDLKIHADSEAIAQKLRERLLPIGYSDDGKDIGSQDANRLLYGGATPFARQVVRWFLAQEGIRVTEKKEWGDSDNDIWVHCSDPAFDGRNIKGSFPVDICGDDYGQVLALQERLQQNGFEDVRARLLDSDLPQRFTIRPGPYGRDAEAEGELRALTEAFLEEREVDFDRFPLEIDSDAEPVGAEISLPLGALAAETLYPYAGDHPERWDIVVRTDDPEEVETLLETLADGGYNRIRVESLPSRSAGFRITWGAARHESEVADYIRGAVEEQMEELGALGDFRLAVTDDFEDKDEIRIDISTSGIDDGRLLSRIVSGAGDWELTLKAPRPSELNALRESLRTLNFKDFDVETVTDIGEPVIKYGGAPPILVEHIAGIVERHTGVRPHGKKEWGDDDDDIWVFVPDHATQPEEELPQVDLSGWFSEGGLASVEPLLAVADEAVRIAHLTLPRRQGHSGQLVPKPELFSHYCLDQRTAETLVHVAESVSLREPCLLEGETSVSKTSIVQYLAHLLNQPVVRINLNGQTDTGELVGRFVPESASDLPIDPDEMLAARELLEEESRQILENVEREGRPLTRFEQQQVMANEGMAHPPWRWQDGLVIAAMKRGWWVILDELNLAEPQILERLNSVLERHPMIVLTEHDNSLIGPGGSPVHPDFRIFATMNPAEYAGRSALSPAYRDRWRGARFVPAPGEAEYHAMLHFLVFGAEPDVHIFGKQYLGGRREAPLAQLSEIDSIDEFLRALARFHTALEGAVGGGGRTARIGARRRERYVFTRRGLLSVMDFLANEGGGGATRAMRTALYRYYIGRVSSSQDQATVCRLLDAAGIGPTTWELGE